MRRSSSIPAISSHYRTESTFAQAWVTWYTNPTGEGALTPPEEPPDDVKRQMELYDQIKATGDLALQEELMKEIIEIAKDQLLCDRHLF